jgi:monoamine oxidase
MNRRDALKYLGFGIATPVVGSPFLSSCAKDDPGPDVPYDGTVVIIGAGAAGLYAADILTSKGINVTILEATDRIGGRLKSLRNIKTPTDALLFPVIPDDPMAPISYADFAVELGAENFLGMDSPWGKIVTNLRLNTMDITATDHKFVIDNIAKSATEWQGDPSFAAAAGFASSLSSLSITTQSVQQAAAGVGERGYALVNSMVGNFYGTSSERLGVAGLAEDLQKIQHEKKLYVLKNNPIQDVLISRFANIVPNVQLNTPVKAIQHSREKITLTLGDGTQMEAGKVIVTVPLAILKNGSISFSPALPSDKLAAMDKLGMDPSLRVILDFKKNLWGDEAGFIWGGKTAPQYFNAGVGRSEFYRTLSITINGPKAAELSAKGKDMITDLLAELDVIYAGKATEFVRRSLVSDEIMYVIQDWSKEKYIGGGFSYPKPAARITDRELLGDSVNDSLFFAGEATDITGESGTLNGALASAERVANDVVESIIGPL